VMKYLKALDGFDVVGVHVEPRAHHLLFRVEGFRG